MKYLFLLLLTASWLRADDEYFASKVIVRNLCGTNIALRFTTAHGDIDGWYPPGDTMQEFTFPTYVKWYWSNPAFWYLGSASEYNKEYHISDQGDDGAAPLLQGHVYVCSFSPGNNPEYYIDEGVVELRDTFTFVSNDITSLNIWVSGFGLAVVMGLTAIGIRWLKGVISGRYLGEVG